MVIILKMNEINIGGWGKVFTGEGVAPTVERWTPNPTVVGSNPTALTFFAYPLSLNLYIRYYNI